ncbi:hypothetical protein AB6A40_008509 [Gnathostoma spinigerum]|uniref:Stress-activated protein kinase JNK n=1 Tax=Gnathostoma spinigerum TaxID=75299 RepID=A0ABD6EPA2_9BILA
MTARRTYREFVLLTTMKHRNLISLENAFSPQTNVENFEEVYLVMEYMRHDLAQVIKNLKLDHNRLSYLVYQMIVAVNYLHRSGIIHRDLKPSNIVVNDECILKILDYGLARKIESGERMSIYVVTRFYRSPEVILGLPYDEKVDVWSIGCIMAELILRHILFPGKDRIDQWSQITQHLGSPPREFVDRLDPHVRLFVRSKGFIPPRSMDEMFPDSYFFGKDPKAPQLNADNARDLLSKMLKYDPKDRISIEDAVHHPYVHLWYDEDEWNAPLPENRYNPQMDFIDQPIEEWKQLLFREVRHFEEGHDVFGSVETEDSEV